MAPKRASLADTRALCAREHRSGIVRTRSTLAGVKLIQVPQQCSPQVAPLGDCTRDPLDQVNDG